MPPEDRMTVAEFMAWHAAWEVYTASLACDLASTLEEIRALPVTDAEDDR